MRKSMEKKKKKTLHEQRMIQAEALFGKLLRDTEDEIIENAQHGMTKKHAEDLVEQYRDVLQRLADS